MFELQTYREGAFYVTSFFNDEKKLGSFLAKMTPIFLFSLVICMDYFKKIKLIRIVSLVILLIFLLVILTTERVAIFISFIFILLLFLKSNFFLNPRSHF